MLLHCALHCIAGVFPLSLSLIPSAIDSKDLSKSKQPSGRVDAVVFAEGGSEREREKTDRYHTARACSSGMSEEVEQKQVPVATTATTAEGDSHPSLLSDVEEDHHVAAVSSTDATTDDDGNDTPQSADTSVESIDPPATPIESSSSSSLEIEIDDIDGEDAEDALENVIAVTLAGESEAVANDQVVAGDVAGDEEEGEVVIVEAATPSSMSFDTLTSPASAAEPLLGADAAGVQVEVEGVAGSEETAASKQVEEVNSDDVIEKANEKAAAESKAEAKTGEESPSEGGEQAKESKEAADAEAADAEAAEKKPKHTNVDEVTAKVLES